MLCLLRSYDGSTPSEGTYSGTIMKVYDVLTMIVIVVRSCGVVAYHLVLSMRGFRFDSGLDRHCSYDDWYRR